MSRAHPSNLARSVRQRLLNISRQRREDFQWTLIRYALERLLFRLSQSPHRSRFVLKGAMLFQIWSRETRRPTRDVDFLGMGEPTADQFLPIFRDLCEMYVPEDGLRFDADSLRVEAMKEGEQYQGLRIRGHAFLENARIPVQVDLGFGDAITPSPQEVVYPTVLDFEAPRLNAYPQETVIAEKYQAMVSLGIANSRMKDFFDLWLLSRRFRFDGPLLCDAIAATFGRRQTMLPVETPLALTEEFTGERQKQAQWNALVSKGQLNAEGKSLPEIAETLRRFLVPPTEALNGSVAFSRVWNAGGPWQATSSGKADEVGSRLAGTH